MSNPICIFAQGRSGSTLLLRILNNHGCSICGENYGALFDLLLANDKLNRCAPHGPDKQTFSAMEEKGEKSAWFQHYDLKSVNQSCRQMLEALFNPKGAVVPWGCKEMS